MSKNKTEKTYKVQCLNGHVWAVNKWSIFYRRCVAHEVKGFVDALTVTRSECPKCQDEDENTAFMLIP